MNDPALKAKNKKVLGGAFLIVAMMIGLAYASVPLYTLFCQITGFGGTTQRAEAAPGEVAGGREITVRFNADTARDLPWRFKPEQNKVTVTVGSDQIVAYAAENKTGQAIAGTAVFNVTPPKAGKYFTKVDCFCFSEQVLQPHQKVNMPVAFYIDPSIEDDPNMNDVKTITLSYTFYRIDTPALERALDAL